jgi:acetyltransferase-like isoleucine patch superfamily enzyme
MIRSVINKFLSKIAFITPGGSTLRPWLHRLRGVKISKNVWISQYVFIDELHPECITIKENVSIGLRTTIFAHLYWGGKGPDKKPGKVVIEKNVFIGPHCVILPNVTIGEGSVIMAGTVVSRSVPPEVLYGYAPASPIAKVTCPLVEGKTYEEFLLGLRRL